MLGETHKPSLYNHRCDDHHVWEVECHFNPMIGSIFYPNVLGALCPYCGVIGTIALRLQGGTQRLIAYSRCLACKRDVSAHMYLVPETTVAEQVQGFSRWKVPTPFPVYCAFCRASRIHP